jgi:hypothetical protein
LTEKVFEAFRDADGGYSLSIAGPIAWLSIPEMNHPEDSADHPVLRWTGTSAASHLIINSERIIRPLSVLFPEPLNSAM